MMVKLKTDLKSIDVVIDASRNIVLKDLTILGISLNITFILDGLKVS